MIQECETCQDLEGLVAASKKKPVFLFKHSTTCPISAGRWGVLQSYARHETRADFYRLLVVENRPLSLQVAEQAGVKHQSPQVMLFSNGQVVWNTSHGSITEESMMTALERALLR